MDCISVGQLVDNCGVWSDSISIRLPYTLVFPSLLECIFFSKLCSLVLYNDDGAAFICVSPRSKSHCRNGKHRRPQTNNTTNHSKHVYLFLTSLNTRLFLLHKPYKTSRKPMSPGASKRESGCEAHWASRRLGRPSLSRLASSLGTWAAVICEPRTSRSSSSWRRAQLRGEVGRTERNIGLKEWRLRRGGLLSAVLLGLQQVFGN